MVKKITLPRSCRKNFTQVAKRSCVFSALLFALSVTSVAAGGHKGAAAGAMPPAIVEVAPVKYSVIYDKVTATGTLTAFPGVVIKPEISGRITNIYFKSGDKVAAGASLIELYPDIVKAQLTQAQAELKLAQLNFDRYARLYETRTVPKADYDKSKSALDASKGKVEQAQASLSQTLIRAPFAGRLGIIQVSLGQYISAGQDMVSLEALDPIYVDFGVPETYVGKIVVGQELNVRIGSYPNETFRGRVQAIDPLVNQRTRSMTVRAAIPNKDEKLLPGVFADVTLFLSGEKKILEISQTAIVYDPNGDYVYRVIGGKAVKTVVKLGARDAKSVVVQSGLNEGDVIVTAGQLKITLGPGDAPVPVIVLPQNKAGVK